MIWLFPLYLLGAAAVIGPILMHLRRRPPQEKVEFSSLMFLEAHTPVPVSKRRLEHWLLLLLRCLALILLALMFARPLWSGGDEQATGDGSALILLVDRSASMRRGDLWSQAQKAVQERLGKGSPADRVAVAVFDREVRPLLGFAEDREAASSRMVSVRQRLADQSPGWASTDVGRALAEAVSWFGHEPDLAGLKKRIILVTDFQEGARLDALRSQVWPENVSVEVVRLELEKSADNFSLSLAAVNPESESGSLSDAAAEKSRAQAGVRVRLANARDSGLTDYAVAWEKGGGEGVSGHLPPGAVRVVSIPPAAGSGPGILRLSGDAWDFDNRIFIAPPQPTKVSLVFVGDETTRDEAASPLFYLSRALQKTATLLPDLQVVPASAAALPQGTDIAFVSGRSPGAALVQGLKSFMEAGGMVVQVVDEAADLEALSALGGVRFASVKAAAGGQEYRMLAQVDTAHPLLRPFADERLRDFTKLHFWKHRLLGWESAAADKLEVLARFDDQSPAILSVKQGKGTLILLTSGWHPADSQLALSTKFVPLLYGWLEAAGFRNEQPSSWLVGDVLPVSPGTAVMTPEGQKLSVSADAPLVAAEAGLYTAAPGTTEARLLAVNLDPEETRILPMEAERLRELGVRLEAEGSEADLAAKQEEHERLATSEQEGRQRAWLWLLGGLLAVLAAETWLAGRIRQTAAQPAYS